MTGIHKDTSKFRKMIGLFLIAMSLCAIVGLVFFYSVVLFSDNFSEFSRSYYLFRLLFSVPSGLIVIWMLFFIVLLPCILIMLFGLWLYDRTYHISRLRVLVIVGIWAVALFIGTIATVQQVGLMLNRIVPFSTDPITFQVSGDIPFAVRDVFRTTVKKEVQDRLGNPKDGFEPYMLIEAFPGLTDSDFEGVESSIGHYTMKDGKLIHETDNTRLIHPAANAITDEGFDTLLGNVSIRLGVDLTKDGTLTEIMQALVRSDTASST